MSDSVKDLVLAVFLVAFGAFVFIDITHTQQAGFSVIESVSFSTLPSIYAGLLVALAMLYGANSIRGILLARDQRDVESGETAQRISGTGEQSEKIVAIRTVGTVVTSFVFVLLLEYVNFFVLTTAFLFVMFRLYGQKSLALTGIVSIFGGTAFYVLFIVILKMPI